MKQPKPRAYTVDEVRDIFLDTCWDYVNEWSKSTRATSDEKVAGVVFSLLALIDGSNAELPGFVLAPDPHQDDADYRKQNGENWFPSLYPMKKDEGEIPDIAGSLHEKFYERRK